MAQGLTLTTDDQIDYATAGNTEVFDDTTASSDLPNITVWVIQADGDIYEIAVTMGAGGITGALIVQKAWIGIGVGI